MEDVRGRSKRRRPRSSRWIVALALLAVLVPAASALAKHASTTFKATKWKVVTGGVLALPSQPTSQTHTVKPNGTLTMCNMGRFATLSLYFSFKNAPTQAFDKHGRPIYPFKMTFSGPEGTSRPASYGTPHDNHSHALANGNGLFIWAFVGDFPGHKAASVPIPAGKYTVTLKQGSKALMRVSITFKSTNTC
jgi:hypothetical protein